MLRADTYANFLATKEYDQFWQSIQEILMFTVSKYQKTLLFLYAKISEI